MIDPPTLKIYLVFFICVLFNPGTTKAQVNYGSVASYGLRLQNPTYTGNAIQVRRACDNATKDIGFSCGSLNTTVLQDFVVASNPLSAISSTAAAAFSLRRLSCTYLGKAVNVRRSSDNTTLDIGFTTAGDFDTVALKTFVGAANGFVTKWYDQSANHYDAAQGTNANQPRIVNAGVVDRQNGMPAVAFIASSATVLSYNAAMMTNNMSVSVVAKINNAATRNALFDLGSTGGSYADFVIEANTYSTAGNKWGFYTNNNSLDGTVATSTNLTTISVVALNTFTSTANVISNTSFYVNGTASALSCRSCVTNTYRSSWLNGFTIGNFNTYPAALDGYIPELIVFQSALSNTDRQYLEWSQGQYYAINGPTLGALPASPASGYITKWYDQSGNGYDATQATTANQPIIVNAGVINLQNSLPAISFTGSPQLLQTNLTGVLATTSGNVTTANFVFQSNNSVTGTIFSNGDAGSNRYNIHTPWNDNNTYFDVGDIGSTGRLSGSLTWTGLSIGTFIRNAWQGDVWKNGTNSITSSSLGTSVTSTATISVGGCASYGSYMIGNLSEINIWKTALNTTRRTLLETNQATYYNVTSSNSKYTAAGSYNLFVTGVGRTSATDSVANSQQSAGLGFIVGTTATDYLKDNGDYMTAGMSCPTATISLANLPSGVNERWMNDWYINKTDVNTNNGDIKLFFDFSDYRVSGVPSIASNYRLLGRSSTAASFTIVPTTTVVISGDRVVFTVPAANIGNTGYYTIGTVDYSASPLPIELLDFTAVPNGSKVNLNWETATETNNAFFTVEKSKDGINFAKVIDVPGAGTSMSYKGYAETDYQPYAGTSYYRLKQTDFNGNYTYFKIVPVNFENQKNITVYPNPADHASNFSVELNGYKNQEVLVVLRDIQGREFFSKVLMSEENSQVFIVDETHSLMPGTYIVTASSNDKIYNYKLIIK